MAKSSVIILPDEVKDVESLRKELASKIMDPRQRKFNELRDQGFDSETASDLAGLSTLNWDAQSRIRLEYAGDVHSPAFKVSESAVQEIPQAIRNIGATAGAAVGTSVGLQIVKSAVEHSSSMIFVGLAAGGTVGAMFAGKFVAAALGKIAAVITVANILSATALVATAYVKKGRV